MKKENDIDANRRMFADRIVKKEIEAPIQHLVQSNEATQQPEAAKSRTKSHEAQLNVHVAVELLKKLKLKGITEDKNIKEMISEAISMYLKS